MFQEYWCEIPYISFSWAVYSAAHLFDGNEFIISATGAALQHCFIFQRIDILQLFLINPHGLPW